MRLLINWLKGVVLSLLEVVDSVNRILLIKNKISKKKKRHEEILVALWSLVLTDCEIKK
jgi:hypothetical protein